MRLNGKIFAVFIWIALALFSYVIVKINPGDEFRKSVPEAGSAVPSTAPVTPANPAPGVSEQAPATPVRP